ncbi:LLM class flavin-dependent oxidoreductase [Leucobacter soli]|uniref:LLM class flavin-dependent oxidoreductase n=1 Tax=Leucobacter soli TaxID=2812850 RepID=UPI0036081A01
MIMQAGASPRGRDFAAKWSEIIFTYGHSAAGMRAFRADMERRFVAAGRRPEECRILPAVQAIVAETEEIARARQEYIFSLIDVDVSVSRAAEYIGYGLTALDPDSRIEDIDFTKVSRGGASDIFFNTMRDEGYTVGETAQRFSFNYLGPEFVGTPEQVADQMQEVFETWGIDGFILAPSVMPSSFEDFARMVVPLLQERGLVRSEYSGTTLREHLAQNEG